MAGQQDNISPLGSNNRRQQGIPAEASLSNDQNEIGKNEKRHESSPEESGSKDKPNTRKLDMGAEVERAISYADDENDDNYDVRKENRFGEVTVIDNAKDLITHVLHVDDNPADSPWTFRAMLIGKFEQVVMPDISTNTLFLSQVSSYASSHLYCRRFSISSPKLSMCRSSFLQ